MASSSMPMGTSPPCSTSSRQTQPGEEHVSCISGLPAFCLPRKDLAASWSLSKERANKNQTKANQLLKTKILLQAGTKNTGLNKRHVGVPSSSQLPPHCSLVQGPDTRVELLLPEGTLWACHFSAVCDPLAFAARKGKMRELPHRFPRASGHLKGQGGGGTISYLFRQEAIISNREETSFEFLTQI